MSEGSAEQTIACPKCGKRYKWRDELATRTAACKGCGRMLRFPPRFVPIASVVGPEPEPLSDDPPAEPEADEGMYDVRAPGLPPPQPVPQMSPQYAAVAPMYPTHRSPVTSSPGRFSLARDPDHESTGLYVLRIIAFVLNALLAAAGALCLLTCNFYGVLAGVLGGVNLFWLAQGNYDGAQRVISILMNVFGMLLGAFLFSMFMLIDLVNVEVYTDVNVDIKTLVKIIYIPLGSITFLACAAAMLYPILRRTD